MRGIHIHAVSTHGCPCECIGARCACGWEAGITGHDWTVWRPDGTKVTGHATAVEDARAEANAAYAAV